MLESVDNQNPERDSEILIEILLREYEGTKQANRFHLDTVFKLMTGWLAIISLTAFGVVNTYANAKLGSVLITLIGTSMLIGIEYLYVTKEDNMLTLAGYTAKIENDINMLCNKDLLIWEQKLVQKLHHPVISIFVFYFLNWIVPFIVLIALYIIVPSLPSITDTLRFWLKAFCIFELVCHCAIVYFMLRLSKQHSMGKNLAVSQSEWAKKWIKKSSSDSRSGK